VFYFQILAKSVQLFTNALSTEVLTIGLMYRTKDSATFI